MTKGISTNRHCVSSAACLLADGVEFVFRYHSTTTQQPQKRLSPQEAAELARAGLDLAVVYQDRARAPEDFGLARGRQDGEAAIVYAGQIGQTPGSAVYFAVDEDFKLAQIRGLIRPYFEGVKAAFDEAGKGQAYLRIGVYGSGLACRVLKQELGFISHTWLAEAPGWWESATYTGWDVRQHRNDGEALCDLGESFERCEASVADFGQFKPVGFDVLHDQGPVRLVVADAANLRLAPTTKFNDPIAQLPHGHVLRVMGESAPGWLRVRTTVGGAQVIGHISASLLGEADVARPQVVQPRAMEAAIPPAHMRADQPAARRDSGNGRAYPLSEAGRPGRDAAASAEQRKAQLRQIADWLNVPVSARYAPHGATYCNIYATDYCYLAGIYLPRVWWTGSALMAFEAGQTPGVVYDKTVREMRADDLYQWLNEFGPQFGWRRVFDATALQDCANAGGVGIVCADREADGRSGHITVVVPEDAGHQAERDVDGFVVEPLQSQAGAENHRYGSAGPSWWRSSAFKAWGFFVHD